MQALEHYVKLVHCIYPVLQVYEMREWDSITQDSEDFSKDFKQVSVTCRRANNIIFVKFTSSRKK